MSSVYFIVVTNLCGRAKINNEAIYYSILANQNAWHGRTYVGLVCKLAVAVAVEISDI